MSGKPIDLEWMDPFYESMTYDQAMSIILEKNKTQPMDEKRWRLPSSYELKIILNNHLPSFIPRKVIYMCRSSRADGRISAIDPKGKQLLFDPKTHLCFCLVR